LSLRHSGGDRGTIGCRSAASRSIAVDTARRRQPLFGPAGARLGRASENIVGVFMYEFMSDQVLGISGLINLSNIVFLVAFSVRDVLKLRILAIVGEGLTLPYYYFQNESCGHRLFGGWRS
jgi:hypothetical protein